MNNMGTTHVLDILSNLCGERIREIRFNTVAIKSRPGPSWEEKFLINNDVSRVLWYMHEAIVQKHRDSGRVQLHVMGYLGDIISRRATYRWEDNHHRTLATGVFICLQGLSWNTGMN